MLILRRRVGETLLIGDDIKVTVTDIYEGGVRLAIEAPREVSILRAELLKAVDANRDAADEQAAPQELMKLLENRELGKTGNLEKRKGVDFHDRQYSDEPAASPVEHVRD